LADWGQADWGQAEQLFIITTRSDPAKPPEAFAPRSDRRPGNRAASASRSPFLIECQGTERSFNAPPHLQDSVGVYMNGQ
jgi:hypothetical protein